MILKIRPCDYQNFGNGAIVTDSCVWVMTSSYNGFWCDFRYFIGHVFYIKRSLTILSVSYPGMGCEILNQVNIFSRRPFSFDTLLTRNVFHLFLFHFYGYQTFHFFSSTLSKSHFYPHFPFLFPFFLILFIELCHPNSITLG